LKVLLQGHVCELNAFLKTSLFMHYQEESLAEFDDASEEVSVADLSVSARSNSSVETTDQNIEQVPSKVACLSPEQVAVASARAPPSTSTTYSSATNAEPNVPFNLQAEASYTAPVAPSATSTSGASSDLAAVAARQHRPPGMLKRDPDEDCNPEALVLDRRPVKRASTESSLDEFMASPSLLSDFKIPAVAEPSNAAVGGTDSNDAMAQQQNQTSRASRYETEKHQPMSLPKFPNPENCMWTSTHAANCPSEDRSSSLVNVLLQPLPPNFDSETQLPTLEPDYKTLIRLSLWSVIDGHGGGCVATYASEVLLPHVAASVSRALGCAIVDRGVCTVNGQLRDANALDLDGLIKTSDRGSSGNPNSIHYRSPFERSDSEGEDDEDEDAVTTANNGAAPPLPVQGSPPVTDEEDNNPISSDNNDSTETGGVSLSHLPTARSSSTHLGSGSVSSVKTSVKTAASINNRDALVGTHSPREVAAITQAITDSFLAVDEGWINSIDPVATHQTSCQSNGRWNSGACALVVFTIQRLDWTDVSRNGPGDRERTRGEPGNSPLHDTSQNRDAARRRMLDFAARAKCASSMSTVSSTSSLTTEEAVHASGLESEITETEGEDDDDKSRSRAEMRAWNAITAVGNMPKESLISAPGGCSCHCYRAHDAILYTGHVGDCRAVMLGSAPPRTIKVRDAFADHPDTTDDESSNHSSDETECLSSSDHDADSSDDDDVLDVEKRSTGSNSSRIKQAAASTAVTSTTATANSYMTCVRRPARRSRRRAIDESSQNAPYYALPPLEREASHRGQSANSPMIELEIGDLERRERRKQRHLNNGPAGVAAEVINGGSIGSGGVEQSDSSSSSQDSGEGMALVQLPPATRPIDLTTDHSAYNPAEVTAVLRRCNNAPRAISAGVGGGIKRVAGSLAVTRALGDAYLKTPRLSFMPYKDHAPYITARPEVNCRPVNSNSDKILILATDGVWERASGDDTLRWVRNFYTERIAEAERRNKRSSKKGKTAPGRDLPTSVILSPNYNGIRLNSASGNGGTLHISNSNSAPKGSLEATQEEEERQDDQNQKMERQSTDLDTGGRGRRRKRDSSITRSPSPPSNKRRKRNGRRGNAVQCGWSRSSSVADVIVRRVLNKVRRARNISSLHALMSLPQGRARRSKHDDITSCVVDLSAFVS